MKSILEKIKQKKNSILYVVGALIVVWLILSFVSKAANWRAVFLDSNQVYFGKFVDIPFSRTIKLKDVYYLKTAESSSTSSAPGVAVVPLEGDIHSPQNYMYISKSHILYFQDLKDTSNLIKAIVDQQKRP